MSKNIVINIYGVDNINVQEIINTQNQSNLDHKNEILVKPKYDLEIDSSIITDLALQSRVRLIEISKVNLFQYNYFIYDGEVYIVKIKNISEDEISFYNPKYDEDISIDLNSIHNLCNVKVVSEN